MFSNRNNVILLLCIMVMFLTGAYAYKLYITQGYHMKSKRVDLCVKLIRDYQGYQLCMKKLSTQSNKKSAEPMSPFECSHDLIGFDSNLQMAGVYFKFPSEMKEQFKTIDLLSSAIPNQDNQKQISAAATVILDEMKKQL